MVEVADTNMHRSFTRHVIYEIHVRSRQYELRDKMFTSACARRHSLEATQERRELGEKAKHREARHVELAGTPTSR